jgi:di/tricarboxylate transporter
MPCVMARPSPSLRTLPPVSDAAIVFIVLGVIVVLFVWNRLPVEIVAIGASLSLAATGVLTLDQSLSGFGDATVVFIAALFVVSEAIDSTGVTAWAGQQLTLHAGSNPRRLMILTMLLVALLTALISVNGAVAALIPMVVIVAVRIGQPPSRWLMPLAFGAHAGSMLALTEPRFTSSWSMPRSTPGRRGSGTSSSPSSASRSSRA